MARLGTHPRNASMLLTPGTLRDVATQVRRQPRAIAMAAWWAYRCHLGDAIETIRAAGLPRGVLWGADDHLLPPWLGARLAEALDAPLRVVNFGANCQAGHDWPIKKPGRFVAELADLLPG
jgi:pimeloyl-ACP methyl ester carboxylesterase